MLNSAQRSKLREAILESIPSEPSQYDQVDAKYVYLPHSHVRALDTNAMLVTGIRGAGKSFWWNALLDPRLRQTLLGRAGTESVDVKTTAGFGLQPGSDRPDKDEIASLLPLASPRIIWKTIVLRQLAGDVVPRTSWRHSVKWVVTHPSEVAAALRTEDSALAKKGQRHVVLFDALDRTADTPSERLDLLKGLLELVLEFRSFAALRAKVFVRPDMLDDPRTRAFPDASKVVASRVSLDWSGLDLYGLLFKYIANSGSLDGASTFRRLTEAAWVQSDKSSFDVPREIRGKAVAQEKVFVQLAGPWMGRNERRGKTYTWVPNHLADALGNVSPRSFLAAIRRAADIAELGPNDG
jgi:hypothetical protein